MLAKKKKFSHKSVKAALTVFLATWGQQNKRCAQHCSAETTRRHHRLQKHVDLTDMRQREVWLQCGALQALQNGNGLSQQYNCYPV